MNEPSEQRTTSQRRAQRDLIVADPERSEGEMGDKGQGTLYSGGPAMPPARVPVDGVDAQATWRQLQSELAIEQGGALDRWINDTWVIGYEDGEFLIGLPDAFRFDWIQTRLRTQIKRKLAVILGRASINVKFCVQPRPVVDAEDASPAPLYNLREEEVMPALPAVAPRTTPRTSGQQVNPRHTFDEFIVGGHNKLAHAVAHAVADRPGTLYNPLFIYGGVGLGKTHLLHAMAIQLAEAGHQVIYCTSEEFTNELIAAIRHQTTDQFRAKYRQVDALLIDDIQFISGKESTQEEFFHTFNHLHAAGKQIVVSSDRPPRALATLEERLRSRFEGGIQTDIQVPDFETRVAILQAKADRQGLRVAQDVLMLVAERVDTNIRELEGALSNLSLQARLHNLALTAGTAATLLNSLAPRRTPCAPARVVHLVATYFGLTPEDLIGRVRTASVARARHVAMYLLREENGLSLPAIGDQLGGRDHTTVRHGVEKMVRDLVGDEDLRRDVTVLREKVYLPFAG